MTGAQPEWDDDRGLDDDAELAPPKRPWPRLTQAIAAVGWASFLAACLATMLFFAVVDPALIHEATTPRVEITRMTGYGVGFFFFWLVGAVAGGIAVYLVRTAHPPERGPGDADE